MRPVQQWKNGQPHRALSSIVDNQLDKTNPIPMATYDPDYIEDLCAALARASSAKPKLFPRFSPDIALRYGVPAALIYRYFCNRWQAEGLGWAAATIALVRSQHPYFDRRTVRKAVELLLSGHKTYPALLQRVRFSGHVYIYRPRFIGGGEDCEPHWFAAALVRSVGLTPAIVYASIQELTYLLPDYSDPDEAYFGWIEHMRLLTRRHPYFSKDSIRRAFGVLVKRKLLQKWSEPVNQTTAHLKSSVLTRVFNNAASKPLNEDDHFAA